MTGPQLYRTAVIIQPRGRAVLCVWAALPGLLAAPFAFWQSVWAGGVFCLFWVCLVFLVRVRACSFAASLSTQALTLYTGVALPGQQVLPRAAITGVQQLRTPLLRLAGASVVIVSAPGTKAILPAIPAQQAAALARLLAEGTS